MCQGIKGNKGVQNMKHGLKYFNRAERSVIRRIKRRRPGWGGVRFLAVALVWLGAGQAFATTQVSDLIVINGQPQPLDSLPLEQYYGPGQPRPRFKAPNTATWRGYVATWALDGGRLYL